MRVAVVGGGIAGLAAAWEMRVDADVTVFDPGPLGGKLRTSELCGVPVDEGPDSFITRTPDALELCDELGLGGELVSPAAGRTLLWHREKTRPLPEGLMLGVPTGIGAILKSGLLSPTGTLRAALDLVMPKTAVDGDTSVAELVNRRLGREVTDVLVGPLLGGIHAAGVQHLSAEATAPQIVAASRRSRSMILGLRRVGSAADRGTPLFATVRKGTGALAARLVERLEEAGVQFRPFRVEGVRIGEARSLSISTNWQADDFDGMVLAVPADEAARVLGPATPAGLADIEMTSVAVVTIFVPDEQWSPPRGFNGILVPPADGRMMTACSFFSGKWPHLKPDGLSILRASAGRYGDGRAERMGDEELVGALVAELGEAVGTPLSPLEARVSRWPSSIPLFRVGHLERVASIEENLNSTSPTLALAGASYFGAGIPACIASGRRAGKRVVASIRCLERRRGSC